jgi:hypothetical protein
VFIFSSLDISLFNESVIEVLKSFEMSDAEKTMVLFSVILEGIVINSKNLQFVFKAFKIKYSIIKVSDLIRTNREHVQLMELLKARDFSNLVLIEGQVLKVDKLFHAFHFIDKIETQIEPSQVHKSIKTLNLSDDVVV